MSLPAEPTKPDFSAKLTNQGFTGSHLISKEELAEAVKHDKWLCMIDDYIAQDEVFITEMNKEIVRLFHERRVLHAKRARFRGRIKARKQQKKHFIQLLRKKMAWEKIKKLREEIGLT